MIAFVISAVLTVWLPAMPIPHRVVNVAERVGAVRRVWSDIRDDGYLLEAWLPAESLTGFDPETHRQLGFYLVVRDAELGEQFLTVGREFPFEYDPSLWQVLELAE